MTEIPAPVKVKALSNYKIGLSFSDGTNGEVDLSHLKKMRLLKFGMNLVFLKRYL